MTLTMISRISKLKENNDNDTPRYVIRFLSVFILLISFKCSVNRLHFFHTHYNHVRLRDFSCHKRSEECATTNCINDHFDSTLREHNKTLLSQIQCPLTETHATEGSHLYFLNLLDPTHSPKPTTICQEKRPQTKGAKRPLLSPSKLHGPQRATSTIPTGDSLNVVSTLFLRTFYCAQPTNFRAIMDAEPIDNMQVFFTLRDYQAPMLVATTNDANEPVEPVFGLDKYFMWNDNQSIPSYSRAVGKAMVVKILKPEPFNPEWFKDDVLKVINVAVEEDLDDKRDVMADLSIHTDADMRDKLLKKINILATTRKAIRQQIKYYCCVTNSGTVLP